MDIPNPFDYLNPARGYDTASGAAKDAQKQANALSSLQWDRQMQGLQHAEGYTNQLQDLYNSLYGGGGHPAPGGVPTPGYGAAPGATGSGSAMQSLPPGPNGVWKDPSASAAPPNNGPGSVSGFVLGKFPNAKPQGAVDSTLSFMGKP
jgi:hypothetical protein